MAKYHVGVDLHKTVAQVCVLGERGEPVEEFRSPLAGPDDGVALVARIAAFLPSVRVCVESVGCNRWFVNSCAKAGLDVVVVHPYALGLKKSGRKTDKRDAAEIARRLFLGDVDTNAKSHYVSDEVFGCRRLLRTRQAQMKRRQQALNQIRALLCTYLLRPPTGGLDTKKGLAWLHSLEMPTPELTFCLRTFVADYEHLLAQIKLLDREIEKLAEKPEVAPLVESLPSVQAQTAATIVYELGDVGRFRRLSNASAYAGLVPRVLQSGEAKAHHGPLDKRGNAHLRWILSQWAVRLITSHEDVARWALPRRRRMPLNKLRVALARRLLVGVVHMLRTGERFSLTKCLRLDREAA